MVIVLLGGSSVSAAQQREPARALFGELPETTRPVSVVNLSVYGGVGEGVTGDEGRDISTAGDSYSGFLANVSYLNRKSDDDATAVSGVNGSPGRTLSASAATAMRYFPATRQYIALDRSARLGFDTRLGRRNSFSAAQSVQFTPFYQFGPTLGTFGTDVDVAPANVDGSATVGRGSYNVGTSLGVARGFSRRGSVSLEYGSSVYLYPSSTENLITQRLGVGLRYGLGRDATFVLGTIHRFGQSGRDGITGPTRAQDIDFGIDYRRSIARRTTLSFTTGTSIVSQAGTSSDESEPTRRFRFKGTVAAQRTVGRDWELRAAFDRNLQFVNGFYDPFFVNSVMAGLTGQMGRRIGVRARADYSTGEALVSGARILDKHVRELHGQVQLNIALSSRWQVFAEHHYSRSRLSAGAQASLADGLFPRPYGRSLRFGLDVRVPHIH